MRTALTISARVQRRGSALVIALFTLMTVAALGVVFLQTTTSTTQRQVADVENLGAFYLAEAGLAESFQAVRMGRTGQVGSALAPAVHGDGLLWVDATETADGQIRLTSTALSGRGRATLALVVEAVEVPLGFFSVEELVIDDVLLVDGFNSEEATYEQEIAEVIAQLPPADPAPETGYQDPTPAPPEVEPISPELEVYVDVVLAHMSMEVLLGYLNAPMSPDKVTVSRNSSMDMQESTTFVGMYPELLAAYESGALFPEPAQPAVEPAITNPLILSEELALDGEELMTLQATDEVALSPSLSPSGVHTASGGLLGSNGNVRFAVGGEAVEVYGDVIPGPGSSVDGLGSGGITGSTDSRASLVELQPVRVPVVAMAAPVYYDGLLPMVVAPGTSGHESIIVAAGAELVLRGPATIVIGSLTLEDGALLTLDTRDGDVALYVTDGMNLLPGSLVETTSDFPDELTIQVGPIETGIDGSPVKLDATSQFHGTIYAPETDVSVGSDFEVYGGIVAKRLEFGAGSRLHFDNARYVGSPIPRIVSWKIVEVPAAARSRVGGPRTTLGVLGDELEPMAQAHDLSSVALNLTYIDSVGVRRIYDGTEDLFDWSTVSEIETVARVATRVQEEPCDDEPEPVVEPEPAPEVDPASFTDQVLRDQIHDVGVSSADLADSLKRAATVSNPILLEAIRRDPPMSSSHLYDVLYKCGPPAVGYPAGTGSGPLSDSILLAAIGANLDSQSLGWVLEQNSPLSASVLQAARDREPPMTAPNMSAVERAQ